jgi:hypothetical protein
MAFLEVAVLPLRAVQALFSIIVLGLTAYLVDAWSNPWDSWSPHSVNFMLFTAVWTLLAVAYLVLAPTRFPRAAHKFAILGVEALTMLFWFAAWVAVAALWGDWYKPARHGSLWSTGVAAIIFSAFIWYVPPSPRVDTRIRSNAMQACFCCNNHPGDAACAPHIERQQRTTAADAGRLVQLPSYDSEYTTMVLGPCPINFRV